MLNPDRQGIIHPEDVEQVLRPDTALLCVQAVNNETGVIQDVDALAAVARKKGVLFFCDAVQSFGHVSQNLHKADLSVPS
jgi:cysteine desulfurase